MITTPTPLRDKLTEEERKRVAEIDAEHAKFAAKPGTNELADRFDLKYDIDGEPISFGTWAIASKNTEGRRIGATHTFDGWFISTVWLGLDHSFGDGPPLVFESMVFAPWWISAVGNDQDCVRYSTYQQAVDGHVAMVKKWNILRRLMVWPKLIWTYYKGN